MNQPDDPTWLPWIVPAGTVLAALVAFIRRFFAMATREELKKAIESAQERIDLRHQENKKDASDLKDEISEIRSAIARIEGQLSGRYPRIER